MKTIFFAEINLFNILIIILFKLLGFKVYFIQISREFRSTSLIKIIEKFGIIWFNYQKNYLKDPVLKIKFKTKKFADEYSKKITELVWNQDLETYFIDKQNLNICLHAKFFENFCKFV